MSVNQKLNAGPTSSLDEIVLVTGASGFIASHIIKQLLERGYRVRGTVRNLNDYKKVFPLKNLVPNPKHELELFEANLNDPSSWLHPIKDCTYVIHTASILSKSSPRDDESEIIRPTVDGLLSILKACVQEESKVKRVILTSSIVTITGDYFENNKTYSEKDRPEVERQTAYTRSKILAERAAWNFVRDREHNGLPCFDISFINPGYVLVIPIRFNSRHMSPSFYVFLILRVHF
jgi:nucleoside-diphosphate-sugar epimerase